MAKKFAVFDIDGTLIRWQLFHAFLDMAGKQGIIDSAAYEKVQAARLEWKKRSGDDSFKAYERTIVPVFIDELLPNITTQQFAHIAELVVERYRDQTYTYTRNLIRELRSRDYLLFAISGSQAEMVGPVARYYGFHDFVATEHESRDGHYTGNLVRLGTANKHESLQKLIDKHGATLAGSIAVGDSECDIEMLEVVENPIAFNPSKKLFRHAQTAGWKVVLERKNMIYELEPRGGSYQLDHTNA